MGSEVNDIPGFDIIALSHPRKLNTKGSGILVAVKKIPYTIFSPVKQTSDNIWVKIGKNILQLDKDILSCSWYIPPSHSSYFDPNILPNLENDINLFKRDDFIVLAGDLNARTGVEHGFINCENCHLEPGGICPSPTMITPRKSLDTHVNDVGKQLLEICNSLEI